MESAGMTNEQAIDILLHMSEHYEWIHGKCVCIDEALMVATVLAIQALHSQKQGKWLKNWCDAGLIGHLYEECSLCGCSMIDTNTLWDAKFCPRCGAQMISEG